MEGDRQQRPQLRGSTGFRQGPSRIPQVAGLFGRSGAGSQISSLYRLRRGARLQGAPTWRRASPRLSAAISASGAGGQEISGRAHAPSSQEHSRAKAGGRENAAEHIDGAHVDGAAPHADERHGDVQVPGVARIGEIHRARHGGPASRTAVRVRRGSDAGRAHSLPRAPAWRRIRQSRKPADCPAPGGPVPVRGLVPERSPPGRSGRTGSACRPGERAPMSS